MIYTKKLLEALIERDKNEIKKKEEEIQSYKKIG